MTRSRMRRRALLAMLAALAIASLWTSRGRLEPRAQPQLQPPPDSGQPQEVPSGLDTSRRRPTEGHQFVVSIESFDQHLRIGRLHDWSVTVLDRAGRPVEDAEIEFEGGMPAHDHGFPTQPRVTRYLGGGAYLVEGVKFNMTGWWEFSFEIRAGGRSDVARFNVVVAD